MFLILGIKISYATCTLTTEMLARTYGIFGRIKTNIEKTKSSGSGRREPPTEAPIGNLTYASILRCEYSNVLDTVPHRWKFQRAIVMNESNATSPQDQYLVGYDVFFQVHRVLLTLCIVVLQCNLYNEEVCSCRDPKAYIGASHIMYHYAIESNRTTIKILECLCKNCVRFIVSYNDKIRSQKMSRRGLTKWPWEESRTLPKWLPPQKLQWLPAPSKTPIWTVKSLAIPLNTQLINIASAWRSCA